MEISPNFVHQRHVIIQIRSVLCCATLYFNYTSVGGGGRAGEVGFGGHPGKFGSEKRGVTPERIRFQGINQQVFPGIGSRFASAFRPRGAWRGGGVDVLTLVRVRRRLVIHLRLVSLLRDHVLPGPVLDVLPVAAALLERARKKIRDDAEEKKIGVRSIRHT